MDKIHPSLKEKAKQMQPLKTNTLTVSSLNNTHNSKSTSVGIQTGVSTSQSKNINKGIKGGTTEIDGVSTIALDYSNDRTNSKTKTLATLGSGNIQIADKENSQTKMLNRDIENNTVDIYNISSHKGLKGELDTRLLTSDGRAEIKEDARKAGKEMQQLDKILPSGSNDNAVLAAAGKTLNFLNTVSLGVIPSDDSDGGIIAQVPVLLGQHDIYQKVIKVASLGSQYVQNNLDDFIKVQESDYYKNASQAVRDTLDGTPDLYVSKEPIKIDTTTASYQNFTNGMMNNEAEAIKNGISQTHKKGDKKVNLTINYNPTHGLLGDVLESAVDKAGGTTGMAEQTGTFIRDVTTARGKNGSNFAAHSQGNILTNSGVKFIKAKGTFEDGGFKNRDYFIDETIKDKEKRERSLPTFAGYGSPVNKDEMAQTLQGDNPDNSPFKFIGNYTNPNDWVGEGLGGNEGNKGESTVLDKVNLINGVNLFINDNVGLRASPHSNYECTQLDAARCGDRP